MKLKTYKPKKALKTSQQVREFSKGKEKKFLMPYKGGVGVVIDGRVKEIFIGKDALKNIKAKYK